MSSSSNGVSLLTVLGVAFVVLKLCHVIEWSWWWVTSPFWGSLAFVFVAVFLYVIVATAKR